MRGYPLLLASDGLVTYVKAFRKAFRSKEHTGQVGAPRLVAWPKVVIGQVVKRYERWRVVDVEQRLVQGSWALLERLLHRTRGGAGGVLNTAYIGRVSACKAVGGGDTCACSTADTTAPTVSSVSPAGGATDVARATNVTATFSEAMDPATLTNSTVTLKAVTTTVTATVSYDAASKKVTLKPSTSLSRQTKYTATVKGGTSGAKDQADNPLAADKVWSFTTGWF